MNRGMEYLRRTLMSYEEKAGRDVKKLKELAGKLSNLDIGEIRMETDVGRERYREALERLLSVVSFLNKDF